MEQPRERDSRLACFASLSCLVTISSNFQGMGDYEGAVGYFTKATQLAPQFSFAAANLALAQYQIGKRNEAIKAMR